VPGELGHQDRAATKEESQMATQDTPPKPAHLPTKAPTAAAIESPVGVLERWRQHRAERERRVIVQWLRRTANRTEEPHPIARRRQALLHYRAAAVRTELLEIAATLEHTHDPDPDCMATLRDLLANGCDSPLYNSDIHVSELRATLHYVRSGL
jgi:hypothetical protein